MSNKRRTVPVLPSHHGQGSQLKALLVKHISAASQFAVRFHLILLSSYFLEELMATDGLTRKKWLPLEANPAVIEQFVRPLGFPETAGFHDIYGLDDDLLALVSQPVLAVLLLFPVDEAAEAARRDEVERAQKAGQMVSPKVWFTLQTVGNACGTVGLLHAIGNNTQNLNLKKGSYLQRFFERTAAMSPAERAKFLEDDTEMEEAHSAAASTGDTAAPDVSEPVDLHFIAFVVVDGGLYSLDGSKPFPIYHGPAQPGETLQASVRVVKEYIERNPNSVQFNLIAMSAE